MAADARLAVALLLALAAANAVGAVVPAWRWILDAPPYLLLIGAVVVTGIAGVATRLPPAWREWRTPGPLPARSDTLERELRLPAGPAAPIAARLAGELRRCGYRAVEQVSRGRWAVHGTRRGWSRFAALASHVALIGLAVGAALGSAFASETVFSLLPGEQALLGEPRPGFTTSMRLDAFDAEFGSGGRPLRLDSTVTFLRDGRAERSEVLTVNAPGSFDGHLVHGWTYGPAARVRVVDLGGRPLFDGSVPLDEPGGGVPTGFVELPSLDVTLGLTLVDADRNVLRITTAGSAGTLDSAELTPRDERRVGQAIVTLKGFEAYVTFLSRSDPGMVVLVPAAVILVVSLAVAYYLPRRRVSVRGDGQRAVLAMRGERFDLPSTELERLAIRLEQAAVR